ncbi:MAG: GH116 family glycosyl-hydrolase [Candidatus Hermodarchaeota archaeon]
MQPKEILQLTGKKLRCAAMPLGGIGTGSIAIGGDGLLKQWQVTNTVKHNAFVPNSFFGVWTKNVENPSELPVCRALICPKVHEDPGFKPAKAVSDHRIGSAAKEMFEILPGVEKIRFNGEYPVAFLDFKDQSLPIDISLISFTPFIPLDPKNSGLPIIIFEFHISNPSNTSCEVTLAGSFLNFLGWDGQKVFKGTESILFAGNVNTPKMIGKWHAIQMRSKTLLKTDRRYGDILFAVDQPDAMMTAQWNNLKDFWAHFSRDGTFPESSSEEMSPIGETWAGSLGSRKILNPGESMNVRFFFAWNFPNRVVDWIIDKTAIPDQNTEFWIGNRYNEWFKNSLEVIKYVQENWNYLVKKTESFHEIFFATTLPPEVITSISATMSTIRTPSCFWMRDGSFHGFEGCHGASSGSLSGGCCPLDCTHVWTYEFSLAHLFPSLERTMRETEFKMQHKSGYLPHRAVIPLYLPQLLKEGNWDMPDPAIDGMLSTILKIYRDFLITGDHEFLKKTWPFILRLMNYIFEHNDKELNGVIYSDQPNTYDCTLYGINSFIGSLYLTALLACERISEELGILDWAEKFRKIYNSGKKLLDRECWNGEYYIQKYDKALIKQHQYGTGCFSDQLIGQWWAFQLGFGYIFPPEHFNKTVESIFKYNFKETLEGITQTPRIFASPEDAGLMNCTWPHGDKPKIPILYTDEIWTGIEYEVAALCIYAGKINEALKIIQAVRDRYDGSHRNPWNEVECGDHYVRAMSSWTLLYALTGANYKMILKQVIFAPRMNAENFTTFFITASAWGQSIQQIFNDKVSCSISVSHGSLEINSILLEKLGGYKPVKCIVILKETQEGDIKPLEARLSMNNSGVEIVLTETMIIKEGHQLIIELN